MCPKLHVLAWKLTSRWVILLSLREGLFQHRSVLAGSMSRLIDGYPRIGGVTSAWRGTTEAYAQICVVWPSSSRGEVSIREKMDSMRPLDHRIAQGYLSIYLYSVVLPCHFRLAWEPSRPHISYTAAPRILCSDRLSWPPDVLPDTPSRRMEGL